MMGWSSTHSEAGLFHEAVKVFSRALLWCPRQEKALRVEILRHRGISLHSLREMTEVWIGIVIPGCSNFCTLSDLWIGVGDCDFP